MDSVPARHIVLECKGVSKEFLGLKALDGVDFNLKEGEVHALVGQNGAGKSTLVKILTGVYPLDAGTISIDGKFVSLKTPRDAESHGVSIVHQDQPLVPQLDVTRNVFLGKEKKNPLGLLDFAAMKSATFQVLQRIDADFSSDAFVQDLSVGQREQVAIASALIKEPKVLILDEPTASLSEREIRRLFEVIEVLRESGVSIIYISHHLSEVFRISSRITVLRDGQVVSTLETAETDREAVVRLTVGRDLKSLYPKEFIAAGPVLLSVKNLSDGGRFHDISFEVRAGEIYGMAGLVGAGRTEIASSIFGAGSVTAGSVTVSGQPVRNKSPLKARKNGFALIPEDRRGEGLIGSLNIRQNMAIPNLGLWSSLNLMNLERERLTVRQLISRLAIAASGPEQQTETLSGGNQQKVVIGKWLAGDARIFLFDEPTTGVDVGAKVEIYREMTNLAKAGAAVIFISSEMEELVGMCDRVGVVVKGRLTKEVSKDELNLQTLLYWATGYGETTESPDPSVHDKGGHHVVPTPRSTATQQERGPSRTRGQFFVRWGTTIGMLLTVLAIGFGTPEFFRIPNLLNVLKQGSILTLIAYGQTVVLIAGGFDMSAGALNQLTANLAAGMVVRLGTTLSLALGGIVGALVGVVNAFLVVVLRIPAFVATLGTMFMLTGAMLAYNEGQAISLSNLPNFFFLGQGYIGPIPFVVVPLTAVLVSLHLLLKHTRTGLYMYAVGENLAAARLRGISQSKSLLVSFVLAGLTVGLTGVLQASYSYGASAVATGLDFMISALAAAFLGSTFSRTGELSIIGTTVAAIFITSLSNGLILNGVSNLALPAIQGGILVLSILFSVIQRREIGQVTVF